MGCLHKVNLTKAKFWYSRPNLFKRMTIFTLSRGFKNSKIINCTRLNLIN